MTLYTAHDNHVILYVLNCQRLLLFLTFLSILLPSPVSLSIRRECDAGPWPHDLFASALVGERGAIFGIISYCKFASCSHRSVYLPLSLAFVPSYRVFVAYDFLPGRRQGDGAPPFTMACMGRSNA